MVNGPDGRKEEAEDRVTEVEVHTDTETEEVKKEIYCQIKEISQSLAMRSISVLREGFMEIEYSLL